MYKQYLLVSVILYNLPLIVGLPLSNTAQELPSTVVKSNIRPQIEINTTKSKNSAKQQSSLTNQPVDENQSTNINLQDDKKKPLPNPHQRLSISTSEPQMVHCRAWPAATTVLSQAASTATNKRSVSPNNACKDKSRYIDILLPR